MILKALKSNILKTALIGGLLAVSIFSIKIEVAQASIFDFFISGCGYGCDVPYYNPCDFGCGYAPQPVYIDPCAYGCGMPQQPMYQYTPYPYMHYQQVYQPPVQNGGYNYVQYPYPIYQYFVNPSPRVSNDVWSNPVRGY